MKLHLGCGERYLEGYENIDFSADEHSVQTKTVADEYADILTLRYPAASIEEIRLHHVFEHFARPVACALLASWYSWLKPGGLIHIEVPDFHKTARAMTSPFTSFKKKLVAERHIFGTHEAVWAVHSGGYTPDILKRQVEFFGYHVTDIHRNSWAGTHNFELLATRSIDKISKIDFKKHAASYLKKYLLDESATEKRLMEVWMDNYKKQIEVSWSYGE